MKLNKETEKEKQQEKENAAKAERRARGKRVEKRCRELLPLIDAAGLKDDERIYDSFQAAKIRDVREWATNGVGDREFYSDDCVVPWRIADLRSMAARLKTTAAALLGEKPDMEAAETDPSAALGMTSPEWQAGEPPRIGRYFCRVDMGDSKPHENRCWWGDDGWSCYGTNLKANGWKVVGWWPLPKEG